MAIQTLIQVRRGTSSEWSGTNPTLSAGEWGLDTTTKRYKIGDGLTAWNSLPYASILPNSNDLVGNSGIGITFSATTGIPVTVSVTGIVASQINDFNAAVDARITNAAVSEEEVQDIIASGDHITTGFLRNGTGLAWDYDDNNNFVSINVTGIPSSLITDFATAVSDQVDTTLTAGTGIVLSYDNGTNTLTIDTSGYSLLNHSHVWSDITDASSIVTTGELAYLSGVVAGTVSSNRAIVVDSDKDVTGVRNLTADGNVTVGGDLIVNGTTTTVNSTTVDIGDNIIRVNTSGLNTGGFEVYTGTDYKELVWNTSNNRWEFSGGNVYTSGNFIGNLNGNADTVTSGVYTYQTGTVTSTMILDGTIVDADININANINVQKLASGSTGQVLQVSSTGIIWGGIDGGTP